MPTRLGAVTLPFTIDTTAAERALDRLEARAEDLPERGGGGGPGAARFGSVRDPWSAPWLGRSISPTTHAMSERQVRRYFVDAAEDRERRENVRRLNARAAMTRTPARPTDLSQMPTLEQFPKSARMLSKVGLAGEESMSLASAGALAAAIYAVPSTIAKAAPYVGAAVQGALPDARIEGLMQQVENLRNTFVGFESYVKSLATGYQKTLQLEGAIARLTGQFHAVPLPGVTSTNAYYQMYQRVDEGERQLDAKFDEFKGKEIARALGSLFIDSLKKVTK